jgi:hypothetical protein
MQVVILHFKNSCYVFASGSDLHSKITITQRAAIGTATTMKQVHRALNTGGNFAVAGHRHLGKKATAVHVGKSRFTRDETEVGLWLDFRSSSTATANTTEGMPCTV